MKIALLGYGRMGKAIEKISHARGHDIVLKIDKCYYGRIKNVWTVAKNAVEKGLLYAYRDRKINKRNFRSLWILRINAAARIH